MGLTGGMRLGPYEIVAPLGAGGMGEVYRARDTRLDRSVAIKVLSADTAGDPQFRDRFEREARTASALNHPNIVSVFDVGRDREVDFLVTELVDGVTLRERIAGRALAVREVVSLGAQIADGLAAAHAAGLVHRDLKPENVMVARDGRVKILDFGLAKPHSEMLAGQQTQTVISQGGILVGTLGYVAPEQVRGSTATAQSDLFSLGVVLYELAAGRRPFARATPIETLNAVLNDDSPELPPATPAGLRHVIAHCLEKEPERRFQTAADLAFALRSFASTHAAATSPARHGRTTERRIVRWGAGAALLGVGFVAARLSSSTAFDASAIELVPLAIESAAESHAALSPDGRSVAYFISSGDSADLVVKSENSPVPAVLSRGHRISTSQVFWSPDGERVYFTEGVRLRSVALIGGEARDELTGVSGAHVAPDGQTFAALKINEGSSRREAQLFVGRRDALRVYEPAPVSGAFDCVPNYLRFAPDGSKILLWVTCGGNGLIVVPAPGPDGRGGPARRLWETEAGMPQGVDWLDDSRHVMLASRDDLWLGDTAGGTLTRLTTAMAAIRGPGVGRDNVAAFTEEVEDYGIVELPLAGGAPREIANSIRYDGDAAWQSHGSALAYVVNRGQADEIWVRSSHDASARPLLTPADFPDQPAEMLRSLTFSPDGRWLAFTAYTARTLTGGVWIVPASGGAPRRVSPRDALATRGTWSPDGRSMALYLTRGGPAELWIASIGSSNMRRIMLPPDLVLRQAEWSPTGEWIAAIEWRSDGGPRATILINPTNGVLQRLPPLESNVLAWSRDGARLYGVAATGPTSELRTVDVATGTVRTVATYDRRVLIAENVGNSLRLSLSPDGRSFATTTLTNRSNVWLIRGLRQPDRRWWRGASRNP